MSDDAVTHRSSSVRPRLGEDETYYAPESLGPALTSGFKWKLSSQLIREGSRLAMAIVLARLLTPEEWGVAGMALAVAGFLQLVPDVAVGYALVQRDTISEKDRSTAFWISVALGLAVTGLGIAFSGVVAGFFGEPEVRGLLIAASLGFTISSLGSVPIALMLRELAYRSIELRQIVGTVVGAVVAVALAFAGAGPWAIIANSLAATSVSTLLVWLLTPWRPRFVFARESGKDIGRFGMSVFGWQFLSYVQLSADKILVGRYLGSAALGNYAFAYNLMFTPILNVAYPLQQVLFPALATIQREEERLTAAWLRAKRLVVALIAPAFLTIAVVAPDFIPVVFGSRWEDAIPVLQLLCLAGVAHSLSTLNATILVVRGHVHALLVLTLLVLTAMIVGVAVGLEWGIVGVASAYAIVQWLVVLPETWLATRRGTAGLRRTLITAASPLPFAFPAVGVGLATRWALVEAAVPPAVRIVVAATAVLIAYAALVWTGSPILRGEAKRGLDRLRRWRSRPSET